jgi:neutral ceramidase
MKAGVSIVRITPDRPIRLAGFAARNKISQGIYHELYAKALVLQEGDARVAIVTSDIIGLDRERCDEVKAAIGASTGLGPEQVLLSYSHTHSGPVVGSDEDYWKGLVDRFRTVVTQADQQSQDVRMDYAEYSCTIGVNRRLPTENGIAFRPYPEGPTDPEVSILRVMRGNGTPLAILVCYPCHPTEVGPAGWGGYHVGAGYPGYTQDFLQAVYPGCTAMFMQGCGGDVKPRNVDGIGHFTSGPLGVPQSVGEELGRAVATKLGGITEPISGALNITLEEFDLPVDEPPSREQAEAWVNDSDADGGLKGYAQSILDVYDQEDKEFRKPPVLTHHAVSIGNFVLVTLSAEMCVGYSLRLKEALEGRPRIVGAYSNGMVGYVPSADMIPEGGYEVHYARRGGGLLKPDVEDIIVKRVMDTVACEHTEAA